HRLRAQLGEPTIEVGGTLPAHRPRFGGTLPFSHGRNRPPDLFGELLLRHPQRRVTQRPHLDPCPNLNDHAKPPVAANLSGSVAVLYDCCPWDREHRSMRLEPAPAPGRTTRPASTLRGRRPRNSSAPGARHDTPPRRHCARTTTSAQTT